MYVSRIKNTERQIVYFPDDVDGSFFSEVTRYKMPKDVNVIFGYVLW